MPKIRGNYNSKSLLFKIIKFYRNWIFIKINCCIAIFNQAKKKSQEITYQIIWISLLFFFIKKLGLNY